MNEMALDPPDPLIRARLAVGGWLGVPKNRFIRGGAAAALVLLIVLAFSLFPASRPEAVDIRKLPELPARPEDIEKHGKAAVTTLSPGDARARNEQVAFDPRVGDIALPFSFAGSESDRTQAVECLAAAVLYEAGDDRAGQQAVAQVVLNRVRHAAFPGTICGVVYQGSQRRTGCQFTFTCDGSLGRIMGEAAWRRARAVAASAIAGQVDRAVGLATHYHTNWVYPYWSPHLRKLAQVGTHLFFGWPGSWGGPGAFRKVYRGNETGFRPATAGAAAASASEQDVTAMGEQPQILGLPQAPAKLPQGMGTVPLYGNKVRLVRPDGRAFGLLSPPGTSAAQVVNAALALCGKPGPCRVNAWGNEDDVPAAFPIPALTRSTMVFEYVRDGAGGATTRFDCARFPNKDPKTCLEAAGDAPDVLAGVRFK